MHLSACARFLNEECELAWVREGAAVSHHDPIAAHKRSFRSIKETGYGRWQ